MTYHNLATDFFIEPKYRIYRHISLIIPLVVIALFDSINLSQDVTEQQEYTIIIRSLILFLAYIVTIYFNIYVLVPRLLLTKRYGLYILSFSLVVLFLLFMDVSSQSFEIKNGFISSNGSFMKLFLLHLLPLTSMYAICLAGSSMPIFFRCWIISGKRMSELEKATIQSELEYLKTQIQPHFLFNILDKSVMLTPKDPERASQILIKLSKLLRYQLYDSTREKVLLNAEVTFLRNFLELEKDRRNGCGFSFSISTEENSNQLLIPPLLLTPFVEYAINRIHMNEKESFVNLSFLVVHNQLYFTCVGTKSRTIAEEIDLVDVKRRLELLFHNSYSLELIENDLTHDIKLSLNLWKH